MATTIPRRSPRIAERTRTPIVEPPEPQPPQAQTRQKDTRVRCYCKRLSSDGILRFCATHKPDAPSDDELLLAYVQLNSYVTEHPLRPIEPYDIYKPIRPDEIEPLIAEYKSYEKELDDELEPHESLYNLCKDLHIDHPFVSLYTKMYAISRTCNSNWDLITDKRIEFNQYGWLAFNRGGKGWRGHSALCEVCNTEIFYESDQQPTIYYCPTHFAEKKKEVNELMKIFMAQPPGIKRTLDVLDYTLDNFEVFPRHKIQVYVASRTTWESPELEKRIKELKKMLDDTE